MSDTNKNSSQTPRNYNYSKNGRHSHSDIFHKSSDRLKFEAYWDEAAVTAGLTSRQLFLGQIRINPKNFLDAYTKHPEGDADIFIPGTRARNRALHGDMVVVRLEPLKNWKVYDAFLPSQVSNPNPLAHNGQKNNQSKESNSFTTVGEFLRENPSEARELFKNIKHGLMDDLEGFTDPENLPGEPSPTLSSAAQLPWWQLIQRVGRVVSIHRRLNCRACVGFLRPLVSDQNSKRTGQKQPSQQHQDWNMAMFSPTDSRAPRIIIQKVGCPADFVRQPETFKLVRFVARITDWPEDSLFAKGELLRKFDENSMSLVEAETERILVTAGFPFGISEINTFPKDVDDCVEKMLRKLEKEQEAEFKLRRDIRSQCVFTIDPRTARDLDDALHIRRLSSDEVAALEARGAPGAVYEVGVHIADVSYYVRPDTPLDREAMQRSTTIYLVELCVPMLPRKLCEDLCSLHPGTDKLAFSVIFVVNEEAEILTKWFGRTVIRSRAKLSYEDAQSFLNEPNRDWKNEDFPTVDTSSSVPEIYQSILLLNKLANSIRARRFEDGSLQLTQVKPVFVLSEHGLPIGVSPFIRKEANQLIEEWMLAANEAVATLLAERLPGTAFLRRHPPPTAKQIKEAQVALKSVGVDIQIRTAGELQQSLCRLAGCSLAEGWSHSDELAELCVSMTNCNVSVTKSTAPADGEKNTLSGEAHMLATLNLLTKCMNLAEYFCLGAVSDRFSCSHYALNMENYTHFTSPIRRYADIIVHRQLATILAENADQASCADVFKAYKKTSTWPVLSRPRELDSMANYCNTKKQDARRASEESAELYFTLFVKECGPITEACSVVSILTHSFDILLLSTGIIKRVYLNRLDLKSFEYKGPAQEYKNVAGTGVLYLGWNVCLPDQENAEKRDDKSLKEVPFDPAICRAVPAASDSETLIGRGAATAQPDPVAPCACFTTKLRLFDVCQAVITVADDSSQEQKASSSEEELPRLALENRRMPKLVATILRPTCELCENYT